MTVDYAAESALPSQSVVGSESVGAGSVIKQENRSAAYRTSQIRAVGTPP
jgi:hypothetical protein